MDESSARNENWPIPKLKSIVAVFFGLFCILCFKKLIGFGRKWKNILLDWGYRSLNVRSLWISDTLVDETGSAETTTNVLPGHGRVNTHAKRIPALRLPDAWPNFLLTWMYFNLSAVSHFVPAWIAALNEELEKMRIKRLDNTPGGTEHCGSFTEFKVENVHKPSAPPRLSFIETSASGSTKELHFHCTFSSPEVCLALTLTPSKRPSDSEVTKDAAVAEHYVARLQQIFCRVHIICAVLEGDYVLLTLKVVSPLLMQPLSILHMDMKPVNELQGSRLRWIKDNIYLAIQSATTRLVISPLCFTVVQQPVIPVTPMGSASGGAIVSTNAVASTTAMSTTMMSPSQTPGAATIDPVSVGLHTITAIDIRVLYAVMLEPAELNLTDPLRCLIRWNLTVVHSGDATTQHTPGADTALEHPAVLFTTSGVRLESRSWPGEASRSNFLGSGGRHLTSSAMNIGSGSGSHVAVWNQGAYIPITDVSSSLLDVIIFSEPRGDSITSESQPLCGHAILPLLRSSYGPQHVLLVDCYSGNPNDDWHTCVSKSPEVRAKFMLILRVQLFSDPPVISDQPTPCLTSPTLADRTLTQSSLVASTPQTSHGTAPTSAHHNPLPGVAQLRSDDTANTSQSTLSSEQLAEFMSPASVTSLEPIVTRSYLQFERRRSRSFGDKPKGSADVEVTKRHSSLLANNSADAIQWTTGEDALLNSVDARGCPSNSSAPFVRPTLPPTDDGSVRGYAQTSVSNPSDAGSLRKHKKRFSLRFLRKKPDLVARDLSHDSDHSPHLSVHLKPPKNSLSLTNPYNSELGERSEPKSRIRRLMEWSVRLQKRTSFRNRAKHGASHRRMSE